MTRKEHLYNYLEWLITPQDDSESKLFKNNNLVDDYIGLKAKMEYMTERELINEINIQLKPYNISVDETK